MKQDWRMNLCGAICVAAMCVPAGAWAQEQSATQQTASAAAELQLVPQPREVKLTLPASGQAGGEAFTVTRRTRIVVDSKFGREFQGAEMLVDEIEQRTGWKLKISDAREMPGGSDFIFIGDATTDSRLRDALGTSGLAMQQGFDAQGYAILADRHRILVGGASEQGAFYGVQTLRQLLRPASDNAASETADSSESRRNVAAPLGMTSGIPPFAKNAKDGAPENANSNADSRHGGQVSSQKALLGMTNKEWSAGGIADFSASFVRVAAETPGAVPVVNGTNSNADSSSDAGRILLRMTDKDGYVRGNDSDASETADSSESRRDPAGPLGMTQKNKSTRAAENGDSTKNEDASELECPAVGIRDWPAMKWRGVSIDISRGPIPKLDFMEKQIRVLAGYKLNMYALYMEDVFTVQGNQIFAPPDALSAEEIKQLVAYAAKYYVTIVPELETFGHLHNILRYDLYSDLAEIPHGSVLTPTQQGSYDLLGKLVGEMAPLFPGPFFHIGADETFELGQGQTKQLIAEKGLGPVYLAHIAKLDEMLKPYKKQTMFWADIAEKFPQLLPTLPKDLIAVIWTYDNEASYDNRLKPFQDAGLPIFVSPGITNWRRVYPDFNYSFVNIRNLTRDGQKYGAQGMLNTDWKDMGEELGGMDWPGLVFGAACAWQAGESSIEQFRESYDWAFYRNTDHTFEDILDNLASTNTLFDGVKLEGTHVSYFWADPFSEAGAQYAEIAAPVVHQMRVDAERAWESLLDNRGKARANADTLDDLIFAAQRLDLLGMKLEYTQEMSAAYWDAYMDMSSSRNEYSNLEVISSINGELQDLREKLTQLRGEYAERWRAENNETWLANVLVRYDALTNAVQNKMNAIVALEGDFSGVKVLPPPETMGFYYRPAPEPSAHP